MKSVCLLYASEEYISLDSEIELNYLTHIETKYLVKYVLKS